jgi:hypothetical protein
MQYELSDCNNMSDGPSLFRTAVERRPDITIRFEGQDIPACAGESLITTLLTSGLLTGRSEFDQTPRAGFCLMGVCQECTVWTTRGQRLRACMTQAQAGLDLRASAPIEAFAS